MMPAQRGLKRKSVPVASENTNAFEMEDQQIATKTGSPSGSPLKKRRIGVTQAQKQALIDNLQLELTERARKLRAQYNLQAQGLRTRIEIRVNRIPMALRKVKMGDLLDAIANKQPRPKAPLAAISTLTSRPPPVPEKDYYPTRPVPVSHAAPSALGSRAGPGRPAKRPSDEISGVDKENHDANIENPKKRLRGGPAAGQGPDLSKVLSPTSSNSRMNPRERPAPPPPKSLIARPVSPVKQASAGLLSSMVEKARSTRGTATRKATTSSTASSAAGGATATRARRGAAAAQNASTTPARSQTRTAATSRIARRVSGISESSDGSTSTVVRKTGARAAGAATAAARATAAEVPAKRTVMSTIKKGVTSASAARKAPASKPPAPTTTRSGRVLRKRE